MLITISKTLENDIMSFVKLNQVEDINGFLASCLRDGFNIAKYGYSPKDNFNKENKPFKIENYDNKEESNTEGVERKEAKKKGRPRKEAPTNEESSKPKEEEIVKPKKKITIIKN